MYSLLIYLTNILYIFENNKFYSLYYFKPFEPHIIPYADLVLLPSL